MTERAQKGQEHLFTFTLIIGSAAKVLNVWSDVKESGQHPVSEVSEKAKIQKKVEHKKVIKLNY